MSKRLLIVDDDHLFCSLLQTELAQRPGWDVAVTAHPDGAIASIEESLPHLLIIDIKFQGADGFQVLQHLRDREYEVPVLVVTNYPHAVHGARCESFGVREYLVKMDWKLNRLVEKVASHMA